MCVSDFGRNKNYSNMKITKLICFLSVVSCSQQEKLIARNIAIPELAFKIEKEPQEELMGSAKLI